MMFKYFVNATNGLFIYFQIETHGASGVLSSTQTDNTYSQFQSINEPKAHKTLRRNNIHITIT